MQQFQIGDRVVVLPRFSHLYPDHTAVVLEVKLDTLRLASMPAAMALGTSGKIHLTKAWWKQNLASASAQPAIAEDGIASVVFGKVPEFEKVMTECTALKVEAVVAVFKRDVGEGI